MMTTLMLYAEHFEHVHHTVYPFSHLYYFEKVFLDINILLEIVSQFDLFAFGFQTKTCIQVPVATCNEDKVIWLKERHRGDPFIELFQGLCQRLTIFYHILSDPGQLGAKLGQLWVVFWLEIPVELSNFLSLLNIDGENWKLNDFRARLYLLVFDTSRLKIQDKKVLYSWLSWNIVLHSINLLSWKSSSMEFYQFYANITNVQYIVYATVVLALVLQAEDVYHLHHS